MLCSLENVSVITSCARSGVSVVQYNTKWSDKCRQMAAYVDQLCKLHPSVNFLKVGFLNYPLIYKLSPGCIAH